MTIAKVFHPFPFRTRKLSPFAPMVLPYGGRVGRCQAFLCPDLYSIVKKPGNPERGLLEQTRGADSYFGEIARGGFFYLVSVPQERKRRGMLTRYSADCEANARAVPHMVLSVVKISLKKERIATTVEGYVSQDVSPRNVANRASNDARNLTR